MEGNLKLKIFIFNPGGFILSSFSENVQSRVSNLNLTAMDSTKSTLCSLSIQFLVQNCTFHFPFCCFNIIYLVTPRIAKIHVQKYKENYTYIGSYLLQFIVHICEKKNHFNTYLSYLYRVSWQSSLVSRLKRGPTFI